MPDENTSTTTAESQGGASSPSAQGATSTSQGETSTTTHRSVEELERLNTELMRDNAGYRKKAKEQSDAAKSAEEQRLKEQGEFKTLAEQHAARVKELEPISESYAALSAQVNKQISADVKEWPAEILALDPGKEASVETRLAWVAKARPIVTKMAEQTLGRATAPGARPGPRPQGAAGEPNQQDLVKAMRGSGKYGF